MIITGGRRVILFRLILNILEQDQLIFFYVEQKKGKIVWTQFNFRVIYSRRICTIVMKLNRVNAEANRRCPKTPCHVTWLMSNTWNKSAMSPVPQRNDISHPEETFTPISMLPKRTTGTNAYCDSNLESQATIFTLLTGSFNSSLLKVASFKMNVQTLSQNL